jgi:hypothetical protein
VEKANDILLSRGVLTHRVVFMLVIFAMALLLKLPKAEPHRRLNAVLSSHLVIVPQFFRYAITLSNPSLRLYFGDQLTSFLIFVASSTRYGWSDDKGLSG